HGVLDARLGPPVVCPLDLRDPELPAVLDDLLGTRTAPGGPEEQKVLDLSAVRAGLAVPGWLLRRFLIRDDQISEPLQPLEVHRAVELAKRRRRLHVEPEPERSGAIVR